MTSKRLSHLLSLLSFVIPLTFSSLSGENSFLTTVYSPIKKVTSHLNDLETSLDIPHHTISCIAGGIALIATPYFISKSYTYLENCFLDNKPDSYIIKRTNNKLKKMAQEFDEMVHQIEIINNAPDNEKITAKFFFKEKLLRNSQGIYPFLCYTAKITRATSTIKQEQTILERRINYIKTRTISRETMNDVDNDCIIILSTIFNSFKALHEKLESLKIEIINSYEYRNELAHQQMQYVINFSPLNLLLFYLFAL